jgi:hypothetical protein
LGRKSSQGKLTTGWSGRGDPRGSAGACVPGVAQSERGARPRARYARRRRRGAGPGRPPRGGVWRQPHPHARGAAQAPERRGGTSGTSGHVTATSSIRRGVCVRHPASTRETFGVVPWEVCRLSRAPGLRAAGSVLTDRQKSAEGSGSSAQAKLGRPPGAARRGHREAEPHRGRAEGPNGAPRGACRRGGVAACRAETRPP